MPKKQKNAEGTPSPVPEPDSSNFNTENLVELCDKYANDWGHCEMKSFIGNIGMESKNAKLIMINNQPIPCCIEKCRDDDKCSPIKLTTVHCHSAGFSVAPYSVPFGGGKGKVGDNAKPLSVTERVEGPNNTISNALRMWPFKKESIPGNRGPRSENSYLIQSGDTFIMFVNKTDFMKSPHSGENKNSLFPTDMQEIPAFSLLEVHCITKAGDAYVGRDGKLQQQTGCLRFTMIRQLGSSLYSYVDSLMSFPNTMEDAKKFALQKKDSNELISRVLETTDVAFFVPEVLPTATLSDHALESHGLVSVVNWSSDPLDANINIDIPKDILLTYTNTDRIDWATTFLEFAINMRCVRIFVLSSDYYKKDSLSHLRGIPIIDTRKMFSVVDLKAIGAADITEEGVAFDTKCTYRNEDGVDVPIAITAVLPQDYVTLEGEKQPPLRDLIVCSKNFSVSKALPFAFSLGGGVKLRGFLRVDSLSSGSTAGLKRTRLGCDE